MQNLVLFDIDGTLFDPEHFGHLIRAEFIKILNISEEDLIRANADYYAALETTTDFNPREIAAYIAQKFKVEQTLLDRVFWENNQIYKDALYKEVPNVLKKLSNSHTLGIFSQGNEELQARKLAAADIKKYFSDEYIFIHARKMIDEIVAEIPRDATVIDNNHDVVSKLAGFSDAVWINRKTEDADPQVRTIHNLEELLV